MEKIKLDACKCDFSLRQKHWCSLSMVEPSGLWKKQQSRIIAPRVVRLESVMLRWKSCLRLRWHVDQLDVLGCSRASQAEAATELAKHFFFCLNFRANHAEGVNVCFSRWRYVALHLPEASLLKCLKVGQTQCQIHPTWTHQSQQKVGCSTKILVNGQQVRLSTGCYTHTSNQIWTIMTCITNPIQSIQRVDVGTQKSSTTKTKIQRYRRLWLLPSFESALNLNKAIYRGGFGAAGRIM